MSASPTQLPSSVVLNGPRPFGTLLSAAEFGNLAAVREHLDQASPEACIEAACQALRHAPRISGFDGPRAWAVAVQEGVPLILALLVQRLGTPDPQDTEGLTPLMRAAVEGDLLTMGAWLDAGADATCCPGGESVLLVLEKAWGYRSMGDVGDMYCRLAAAGCNPHQAGPDGVCWGRHPRTSGGMRAQVGAAWGAWKLHHHLEQITPSFIHPSHRPRL